MPASNIQHCVCCLRVPGKLHCTSTYGCILHQWSLKRRGKTKFRLRFSLSSFCLYYKCSKMHFAPSIQFLVVKYNRLTYILLRSSSNGWLEIQKIRYEKEAPHLDWRIDPAKNQYSPRQLFVNPLHKPDLYVFHQQPILALPRYHIHFHKWHQQQHPLSG